ncbi:hypothetical protein GGQ62_002033 [Polymorphobacter fuscus]|uniref:Uncharacterized protein n=1 Tax=Sandarakinorhabdus fusca TaxID=1439888 RepID=A0A7C9GNR5_9SPHN|nr:transposase [Polymorphobacter fuscus]MQT16975.1 hypothetical protein [Polymorphobacter fuscus]NJC09035.1 hypothetical protein [Polymorphobacter fuscus]
MLLSVAAREHLEALYWPLGPICPHGGSDDATHLEGKKHRAGLVQRNACRKQFIVTVGNVFERSEVPLHKWLPCNHLICASKKGIIAHEIHRLLGVTYKTAWFMCHLIRIGEAHMSRYCAEFDFRYNTRKANDNERADVAFSGPLESA